MMPVAIEDDSETVNSSANFLPYEVLIRIFAFLPLKDRKNVRLSCRSWYECCTSLSITKNEKFVFRTGFSIQEIAKVLLNPNWLQMNLEFQSLPIDTLPAYTWKACGHRVQSLDFFDCRWNDKTVKNIILYCVNMTSFKIDTSFCTAGHNLGNIFCSPRLLNDLIKKGVKRTKLHTFTMFVDDVQLPNSVLSNIFFIYPSVKHFGTGTYSYEDSFSYCLVLHLGKEPVFSRLDKCFNNSSTPLDSVTFNLPTDGRWMKKCITEPEWQSRLTKFETMLIYKPSMKQTLLDFFTLQKSLTVVRFGLAESSDEFVKKLTFHILESCPNLLEFRLKFEPYNLNLTWQEVPRFFTLISKLRCLALSFNTISDSSSFLETYRSLPSANFALVALRMEYFEMDENLSYTIIKRGELLKHLELTVTSDYILQRIFKKLTNLETLILNEIDTCTNYGFIGRNEEREGGYSIKRLQKLQHLELNGYCGMELTEKFIHELQFPRLECLTLSIGLYKNLTEETLSYLAYNVPALTLLSIDDLETEDCVKKTATFCKQFKNLYRLICTESYLEEIYGEDENLIKSIFEACPSLRYISDHECCMFSFNPFTKKVLCKTCNSFKFRGNVFESDEYFVCSN